MTFNLGRDTEFLTELTFWSDLTPFPKSLRASSSNSHSVLIIGGGVIGLTTAWVLLDKGYNVTVVAKDWASYGKSQRLTSQIAGALWEFPPAVCGQHTDTISLQHSKRWSMISYHIFDAISSSQTLAQESGVKMKSANFFFPAPLEDDVKQLSKMKEIEASGIRGFRRDPRIIYERGVNTAYGAVDAYEHLSPVIDTDQAMSWLMQLVKSKGSEFVTKTIHGDLLHQENELLEEFSADIIVNATGLEGSEIAGDSSCYPMRGGLIRVINDGSDFPKIDCALTISADVGVDSSEIVFIVPRNDKILLIGGITEPNKKDLSLTLKSPIIKRMRARCEAFLPDLKKARMDPEMPLSQGLRPFRQRNVRVERELKKNPETSMPSKIVHSYGHGGAGWSLSFGCAVDVVMLIEEALSGALPKAMSTELPAPT